MDYGMNYGKLLMSIAQVQDEARRKHTAQIDREKKTSYKKVDNYSIRFYFRLHRTSCLSSTIYANDG